MVSEQQTAGRKRFRNTIRAVIRRRMAAGESLGYRDIRREAGGGSLTTIEQELQKAGAEMLTQDRVAQGRQGKENRVLQLEIELNTAHARCRQLEERNERLERSLATALDPQGLMFQRLMALEESVRVSLQETLRRSDRIIRQGESLARHLDGKLVEAKEGRGASKPDPLLEARYRRASNDLAELTVAHERLKRLYFERTGVDPDDALQGRA